LYYTPTSKYLHEYCYAAGAFETLNRSSGNRTISYRYNGRRTIAVCRNAASTPYNMRGNFFYTSDKYGTSEDFPSNEPAPWRMLYIVKYHTSGRDLETTRAINIGKIITCFDKNSYWVYIYIFHWGRHEVFCVHGI